MDKLVRYKQVAQDLIDKLILGSSDDVSPWSEMKIKEREDLAQAFFALSCKKIVNGELKAIEVFELAKRIAPLSASLEYRYAVFWFDYALHSSNAKYLLLSLKHIKHAVDIDPEFFDAWYTWSDVLVHLGLAYHEAHYFHEADEKFQKALTLIIDHEQQLAKFYWDWALCSYFLSKHSGEAVDVRTALQKFQKGLEAGIRDPVFFRDFANAWVEMCILIKDVRFLHKAIELYQQAVSIDENYFDGWLSFAQAFHYLYEITGNDKFLAQAHETYAKAADFHNPNLSLWLGWGNLFLLSGKRKKEPKHLQMSVMKFSKALNMSPQHPEAMSLWGEALILIGSFSNRLDLLRQGEKKLLEAIEKVPDNPDIWQRYAYALYAQGQYFEDADYFSQSIEKYQYALSLKAKHLPSLYGIALAHFALGNIKSDTKLFDMSDDYFEKAVQVDDQKAELFNDWGLLLMRYGEMTDSEYYIDSACLKFKTACDIQKSAPETEYLYNYGCCLDFLGCFSGDIQHHEEAAQVLSHVLYLNSEYKQVRYNLALVFSHLGELTEDIDYFTKAIAQFKLVVEDDQEDEMAWNEWGVTLIHLAHILYEPAKPAVFLKVVEDAEYKLKQAVALGSVKALYDLACLFSLAEQYGDSLYYLRQAEAKEALPSLQELMEDDLLDGLRATEEFQRFLTELSLKYKANS